MVTFYFISKLRLLRLFLFRRNMEPKEFLLQFFEFAHLPPHLAKVAKPFYQLAYDLASILPENPERTMFFRKLLEAKDCAVRARLIPTSSSSQV